MESAKTPKELKHKKADFSEWYHEVIQKAGIIDKRYDVKGMFVWLDYGVQTMRLIKDIWDKLFREHGIKEMYFPLIVPLKYAKMNDEWFEGFKEQCFWLRSQGSEKEEHLLRPTGEPAIYPMMRLWIRTHGDLPIRLYETVSSFRYETRHTIPLIRDREITFWYEIHTAHATEQEAKEELEAHVRINEKIWYELAIPAIKVEKPIWECFPGAGGAIEFYTLMPNKKLLENGSCNDLGQAYAKKFDIKFRDASGKERYVWQTCTGNGARYLAAVIATHGDDFGLVLPPAIAPVQVVIIPIVFKGREEELKHYAKALETQLNSSGIRAYADLGDATAGEKYYYWDLRGVPLRIEVGPKELKEKHVTIVRRVDRYKVKADAGAVEEHVKAQLIKVHELLLNTAKAFYEEHITDAKTLSELEQELKKGKACRVPWCGSKECADSMQVFEGVEVAGSIYKLQANEACVVCGKKAEKVALVGNTY